MIPTSLGAVVLFVDDVQRTKEFYERTFQIANVNEDETSVTFRFDKTFFHLLRTDSAQRQVAPAELGRGTRCMLTIWVEDADAACAELQERRVALVNGPVDQPWGTRAAIFADPDGHLWEVAAELGG
jgi:catechol 2,3-dioxygenase-like lactoylglutathione lyase family enzyme